VVYFANDLAMGETSFYLRDETHKKNKKLLLFLLLLLILGIGAFFVFKSFSPSKVGNSHVSLSPTPTEFVYPTDTPAVSITTTATSASKLTPTPAPTKTSASDKTGVSPITVQNGSGEAGVAGKMSDYLKGLGYSVSSTGNAGSFDYTGVTIQTKASSAKYVLQLKSDLSKQYTVKIASSDLPATSSADIVVIVGK